MPKAAKQQLSSQKPKEPSSKASAAQQPQQREIASAALLKRLADNEEQTRADAVASVGRLLKTKATLDLLDLQKLWKGLWYAMWHSDTPPNQQELARGLADLFLEISSKNYDVFSNAFWTIALREWESLDKYRINKFYLLIRFVLNNKLKRVQAGGWKEKDLARLNTEMTSEVAGPLSYANTKSPHSLRLHLIDIYVDELAKVFESAGETPEADLIKTALAPVLSQLEHSQFKHIKKRVTEEVLSDERLAEWQVLEAEEAEESAASEGSDWEGFD